MSLALFAVAYAALWSALGQPVSSIPAYLISSLEMSSGYPQALGLPVPIELAVVGVGCLLCVFFLLGLEAHRDRAVRPRRDRLAHAAAALEPEGGRVRAYNILKHLAPEHKAVLFTPRSPACGLDATSYVPVVSSKDRLARISQEYFVGVRPDRFP